MEYRIIVARWRTKLGKVLFRAAAVATKMYMCHAMSKDEDRPGMVCCCDIAAAAMTHRKSKFSRAHIVLEENSHGKSRDYLGTICYVQQRAHRFSIKQKNYTPLKRL